MILLTKEGEVQHVLIRQHPYMVFHHSNRRRAIIYRNFRIPHTKIVKNFHFNV